MVDIAKQLQDKLILAIFAVVLLAVGGALMPTVTSSAYDIKTAADAANYTGHTIIGFVGYMIPFAYGLAVVGSVFFLMLKAIKS